MTAALLLLLALGGPRDTLRLAAGVHPGPLVLERPTVVLAEPGAVLRGPGRGSVLTIRGAGSVVRGLTVEHSGRDPDTDDAGVMIAADSVTLEDVTVRDALFGIYLNHVNGVRLTRVAVTGLAELKPDDRGDGITLYYSRDAVIRDATITAARDGIYFSYSDSVVVTGARVTHLRFGLHYMFSHHNRFAHNVFTDNAAGAVIMYSHDFAVTDNVFAWNAGSRSYGLVLQTATDPLVRGNVFVGNGIGVFFDNVLRGDVEDNVIAGNWLGLKLYDNSEETRLTGNAVAGNTFATSGGGRGGYAACVAGRGNYWDGAVREAADFDGDGVLDAPYRAAAPLAELALQRESLRPFLASPAAQVLEWAERGFPLFAVDGLVDSCPLAAPPVPEMLASLPPAPAATAGGLGAQAAAGAGSLGLGLLGLAVATRRRRLAGAAA